MKSYEFERETGGTCERVWMEEMKGRNNAII